MHFFQLILCFWQNSMPAEFICKAWRSKLLFFFHARCRSLYLPHACVEPPTASGSQNQIKLPEAISQIHSKQSWQGLTPLQKADKNHREREKRCQLLQNPISPWPGIVKKLSLENADMKGRGVEAISSHTKLKSMSPWKRTTSVVVKSPTLLHEGREQVQHHFPKSSITPWKP